MSLPCIGDLHIDALEKYIPDAHKKVLSTLDKVMTREENKGATNLVQLGDSFDSPYPDQHFILKYTQTYRKHSDLKVHIIMGNHEWADAQHNALRLMAYFCKIGFINGKVYRKPEVVTIDDERYFFCPHPFVVDAPKSVRYSFGHFGFDGAKSDTGHTLKSKNTPRGRWVLGDYHTAQKGKTYIYPGSLCQVKWHENKDKYYVRLEDTPRLIQITPDIVLDRAVIDAEAALDALDPTVLWSVNITRKVRLPPDWARRYPHIIRHHTEKSTSKRAKILMKKVANDDPLEGLSDYLRNEGMSDKDIKYGMTKFLGR